MNAEYQSAPVTRVDAAAVPSRTPRASMILEWTERSLRIVKAAQRDVANELPAAAPRGRGASDA